MKSRPTYDPASLAGIETGVFTRRQRYHDRQRAKWDDTMLPLPAQYDVRRLVQPTAVAAIRKAFLLAKTSRDAMRSFKRAGRFDPRQAPRATRGQVDVFARRTGTSTTRIKCNVLLDASGSMRGYGTGTISHPDDPSKMVQVTAAEASGVFGATIAQAVGTIPTVDLDVYQHSASGGRLYLKWRWTKGTPVGAFNEVVYGIGGGGNADGHALYALTEKMRREIKRGEKGIILVVSDGLPSQYGMNPTPAPNAPLITIGGNPIHSAGQALIDAVEHARKHGIEVIAVAIDGSDQTAYYGDGMIPFTGNWTALGSALARHLGAALARR